MSSKLNEEMIRRLREAEKEEPQREIPVIVTIVAGTDPGVLERAGLRIRSVVESISTVSGTISAADLHELARLDPIEMIEYDGPVAIQ
jgi:hypothetical protein